MKYSVRVCVLISVFSLITASYDGSHIFSVFIQHGDWPRVHEKESDLQNLSKNELDKVIACCNHHQNKALHIRILLDDPEVTNIKIELDRLRGMLGNIAFELETDPSSMAIFIAEKRAEEIDKNSAASRALDILETERALRDGHYSYLWDAVYNKKEIQKVCQFMKDEEKQAKQLAVHCQKIKTTKK